MIDQTEQLEETTEAPEMEEEVVNETEEVSEPDQGEADAEAESEADGEPVVTFGDDEAPEAKETPAWVKDVRKQNRDLNKKVKDLEKQLTAGKAEETSTLSAKPTLDQFDYDPDKFEEALLNWASEKREHDAKADEAKKQEDKRNQEYQTRLSEYHEGRNDFDADSFDEAEDAVRNVLSESQQGILIHAFGGKAAPLIRGLGQDDKRLKALASIADPIAFAVAATRLEATMKTRRKPKTVPETRAAGNSAPSVSGDKTLQKLRDEAEKTGDLSKVVAYKRTLKAS